jgi:hypothetical protein
MEHSMVDDDSVPVPMPAPAYGARDAIQDVSGLAGIGLASYGAWLMYQPAGFIVGGVLLIALAAVGALRS